MKNVVELFKYRHVQISNNQAIQLKTRSLLLLIKPDTVGMYQKHPQNAITQMAEISHPNVFDLAAIGQLSEHSINQIPDTPQDRTL